MHEALGLIYTTAKKKKEKLSKNEMNRYVALIIQMFKEGLNDHSAG
jgi:hypothetical protein